MSRRKKAFTLDMATGEASTTFGVKAPSGQEWTFRAAAPTDVVRQRMLDKLGRCKTDQEQHELLADWLVARSLDGAERADILAMLKDPATSAEKLSMLMTIVLTGEQPDPKLHRQLMEKLANRLMEDLIHRL